MKSKITKNDFTNLGRFTRAMADKRVVRVGIFGRKNSRNDSGGVTNAEVGFIHEFGQPPRIPKRSFLRMPIFQKSDQILASVKAAGALEKWGAGKGVEVLTDLGIAAEKVILDAFESAGWGSWKGNAPSTVARKGSSSPLIDTSQLRKSIASQVVSP